MLVTTLTKRMAEDLTGYFEELGIRVRYLHSDIDTLERMRLLRDLRQGEFDVLVGINLLREGLDLPEVALVAILDADKEGFLAQHPLADPDLRPGGAQRRRPGDHVRRCRDRLDPCLPAKKPPGAVPRSWPTTRSTASPRKRCASRSAASSTISPNRTTPNCRWPPRLWPSYGSPAELQAEIVRLRGEMLQAAAALEFEQAAALRDRMHPPGETGVGW